MHSDNKQVTTLLNTIKKAINKNISLVQINNSIKQIFIGNNTDRKTINKIIELCCKEYNTNKNELINSSKIKNSIPICRKLVVNLLINELNMSYRKASAELERGVTLSQQAVKYYYELNPDKFEEDKIFLEKYKKIKSIINNQNK